MRRNSRLQSRWIVPAILALSLPALAAGVAADPPGLPAICRDFDAWYRAHGPAADPAAIYGAELNRRGVAPDEVLRRVEVLFDADSDCAAAIGAVFDRIYRSPAPRFNTAPNALVAETVAGMKPGRALDVAMGQGRNAVFLAQSGWEVTGFDVSAEGLAIARAAAAEAGVEIEAVQQGWQEFELGESRWDLIVLTYAWVPIHDPAFVERLCASLRPGGTIVFEHLLRPSRADLGMPVPGQMRHAFDGLRVVRYDEVVASGDWDREASPVVRLVAQKP